MTETASPAVMHQTQAPAEIVCACGCGSTFAPSKPWQRFATARCRADFHARRADQGMRGVVSSVRMLKRGGVSVTLRFAMDERDRAAQLEPGKIVEISQ